MPNNILSKFKALFPAYHEQIKKYHWMASNRSNLVLTLNDGKEYLFCYQNDLHWSFEPLTNRARKL